MSLRAKIFFVLIPVLVIGLLAWFKWRSLAAEEPSAGPSASAAAAPVVRTVTIERQPLETTLTFNGSLVPYDVIDLRSELSGRVRAIHFKDGQEVEEGDLLLEIDTDELEAELRSMREQLKLAVTNAERMQSLFRGNNVSTRERDEAVSRREVLGAEIDRLESRLSKGRITAPFAGTLGLRQVSPGDFVEPSYLITTLQTIDRLQLDFNVPERFRPRIQSSMAVRFEVPGYDEMFEGEVRAIDPQIDRNTRTLTVRAEVENEDKKLLPGNYAKVKLAIRRDNVLSVPAIAVIRSLDSVSVFTVEANKAVRKDVEIGQRSSDSVEIRSGLEAGDRVITSGVQSVRDGGAVKIKANDDDE